MIDFSCGQNSAAVMAVGFHDRWNPMGAILTDNNLLGGGGGTVPGSTALVWMLRCQSLQVVRSTHRPWTLQWYVYCECTLNKSHDSYANMCCVFMHKIHSGYQCVQKKLNEVCKIEEHPSSSIALNLCFGFRNIKIMDIIKYQMYLK